MKHDFVKVNSGQLVKIDWNKKSLIKQNITNSLVFSALEVKVATEKILWQYFFLFLGGSLSKNETCFLNVEESHLLGNSNSK